MQIITQYKQVEAMLTLRPTDQTKTALNSATLSPRERQLLLLLDKEDALSTLAVSKLLGKVDIEKLAEQGYLHFESRAIAEQTANLAENAIEISKGKDPIKPLLKNSKLASFLTAYKAEEMAEAENCSMEQCLECEVVDSCMSEAVKPLLVNEDTTNQRASISQTPSHRHEDDSTPMAEINPEFETIMIVQALMDVA